jgi:hypothetical protein
VRVCTLIAACVVVIGAGCTSADSITGESCAPGPGAPIDEKTLKRAFAAEGIALGRDGSCSAGVVASLSNTPGTMVGEEYDTITAAEGNVLCDVYEPDVGSPSRIERWVWLNDPTPVNVRVLNVSCSVFTENSEHTDAVERAFRRLPGVSHLPAIVPSEDGAPA